MIVISDPTSPVLAGTYDTPGNALCVAVSGEHAFVADYGSGLQVHPDHLHQSDPTSNTGQSLAVDGASDTIVRARLTTTETSGVSWELSGDAGAGWTAFPPGGAWTRILAPGSDLLWRTTHNWWSPGSDNPTVSELTLDWLSEFGPITSITDVPDDQGGWIRLRFDRSGYDFADESTYPINGYQIYQRVDDPVQAGRVRDGPPAVVSDNDLLAAFTKASLRELDDRR